MTYEVRVIPELAVNLPRSSSSRQRLLDFIRSLKSEPEKKADFIELTNRGERLYSAVIDNTCVIYWIDEKSEIVNVDFIQDADS